MFSTSSSSSPDEEKLAKIRQNFFIVKKPSFLRRARTLPHDLRLLKQSQDRRRRKLKQRHQDDITDHLSVMEMELTELHDLLNEDIEQNIKEELYSKYNIARPTVPKMLNVNYSEPSMPTLDVSEYETEPQSEWEENSERVTNYESEGNYAVSVPSTSASPSSASQYSTEQHSPFTETKETTADNELEKEVDSDSDDDDVIIVGEIKNNTSNKKKELSAYQRYRQMLELWNRRVTRIKEELRNKYQTSETSASSFRIQNLKNLMCYVREIELLLQRPNIRRDDEYYAQLQARISITKFMEVCDLGQFTYLNSRYILTLKQADKELAEFQYEWLKSKINSNEI